MLVGGHAPINTAYLFSLNLEELGFSPNDGRDPSFEIYSPPYVFKDRPEILSAPAQVSTARPSTSRWTPPPPSMRCCWCAVPA